MDAGVSFPNRISFNIWTNSAKMISSGEFYVKFLPTFVTLPEDLREVYRLLNCLAPRLCLESELYSLTASCHWR